jgi:hypothetical protein
MALQPVLFPIDQPVMPEDRQIGRRSSIERLQTRLDAVAHQWLIGERRIGKTSVAKAVLVRLRKRGAVALDVDLSKLALSAPEGLAGEIARQAQAAQAGNASAHSQKFGHIARKQRTRVKSLGRALEGLGYEDAGEALDAVSALLAGADDGAPGLDKVLGALSLHARATERRACVLLDEVHLLAGLDRAEEMVAKQCHEPESPIVFILAGSEEAAVRELREAGRPLAAVGEQFELSEIAPEDWLPGLRSRFAEAEVEIETRELEAIVGASGGHPRRTMLIASRVRSSVDGQLDKAASPALVELAIHAAESDLSWR